MTKQKKKADQALRKLSKSRATPGSETHDGKQ